MKLDNTVLKSLKVALVIYSTWGILRVLFQSPTLYENFYAGGIANPTFVGRSLGVIFLLWVAVTVLKSLRDDQ